MAFVQDDQGRVLVLKHTYRRTYPWGLPGGWLHRGESPERGLAREVEEETGFSVAVDALLAAEFFDGAQIDLLYHCTPLSGAYHATDETSHARWVALDDLPPLLANQALMLRKARLLPPLASSRPTNQPGM